MAKEPIADVEDTDVTQPDTDTEDNSGADGDEVGAELDESDDAAGQPDGSGDEGGEDADGVDEVEPEPERRPSRGSARIADLAKRTKEAEERAERVERQLSELTHSRNEQLSGQQEQERLALMTPEERSTYMLDKTRREFDYKLGQVQFRSADQADKVAFDAKVASNAVFSKYAGEVETRLGNLRRGDPAKGIPPQNIPRLEMLKWVIGDRALAQAANPSKAKQNGQKRLAQQQVSPSNAKGNVASNRGRQPDTPEKRLDGVLL